MPLGGDEVDSFGGLASDLIALREARLASAAEVAWRASASAGGGGSPPVYVIGTDVPLPGGIQAQEDAVLVTTADEFEQTVASCRREFEAGGAKDAWNRVIAVVVQPGVEFGDHEVHAYERKQADALIAAAREHPDLLLEGHSTDYQCPEYLRQLVEDGVAILKVGPALTFALRECLFALECIEKEMFGWTYKARLSQLWMYLDKAMRDNPVHWQSYYNGDPQDVQLSLKYSLLDRSRYYWQVPMVKEAVDFLIRNLKRIEIPPALISQYLPRHYRQIREGKLNPDPEDLIDASIRMVLQDYSKAVLP
jgi:D-tagatose-1,6-bisphosphate aldolase subunit GatZ/KbaZ